MMNKDLKANKQLSVDDIINETTDEDLIHLEGHDINIDMILNSNEYSVMNMITNSADQKNKLTNTNLYSNNQGSTISNFKFNPNLNSRNSANIQDKELQKMLDEADKLYKNDEFKDDDYKSYIDTLNLNLDTNNNDTIVAYRRKTEGEENLPYKSKYFLLTYFIRPYRIHKLHGKCLHKI